MNWIKKYWIIILVAVVVLAFGFIYCFNHKQVETPVETVVPEVVETIAPMEDLVE